MSEWFDTTLGEVLELKRGYDLPSAKRTPGPIPIISSSGPSAFHSEAKVDGPGVITGRYGTIGQVFFSEEAFWPLNTALYVRDFKGNHPLFCYYFLKTLDWNKFNDKSGVPGVNRNDAHREYVSLPPFSKQREIAAILGSLDDKIELNRKMAATLEEMARALYRSWFVDFYPVHAKAAGRAPAHMDTQIAALFPDSFGEDGLPVGWKVGSIGHELEIMDSKRIPLSKTQRLERQGGIPYYGATSVMDYVDSHLFDEVLLLVGEDGSVENKEGKPFTQYIWGKSWVNNHAHVLRGKRFSVEQLKCIFDATEISPFITGAVQLKLNQGNMKKIPHIFASEAVHAKFDEVIAPWFKRLRLLSDENQTLAALRDTLLPRLMSGELRVGEAKEQVEAVA